MTERAERTVWRVLGGIALVILCPVAAAWAGWVSVQSLAVPSVVDRVADLRDSVKRIEEKLDRLLER